MLELLSDPQVWASLATLTALEIVLGIDNIIFISILSGKLPVEKRATARTLGLVGALLTRLALLASIAWIARLETPLFSVLGHGLSGKDLILLGGGLFLMAKGTHEIHNSLEGDDDHGTTGAVKHGMVGVIAQIMVLDIVFSLDSVITAVGMSNHLEIMMAAVVIAMIVMLFASGPISAFVQHHPTVKMLALSFLLLVGMALIADSLGVHIPKGYLYFAIAFSVAVESLNLISSKKRKAKELANRL